MRVALLGATDPMACEYLSALSRKGGTFEFVGVAEPSPVGKTLAERFGVPWWASVEDMASGGLDAAVVGGCLGQRPEWLGRAAGLVRHVLCAMPTGASVAESEQAASLCATNRVSLHPAWPWRFLAVVDTLYAAAADGSLGQLLSFNLQYRARRLMPEADSAVVRHAMLQHLTEAIDLVCWLGASEVVDYHAEVVRGMWHAGGAVDAAVVSVALANGAYATLDVSLALPPTFPTPEVLQLETIGTGGWVRLDAQQQHIQVHTVEEARWCDWGSRPIAGLLDAFADAVRRDHVPTLDQALRIQALALSVLDS